MFTFPCAYFLFAGLCWIDSQICPLNKNQIILSSSCRNSLYIRNTSPSSGVRLAYVFPSWCLTFLCSCFPAPYGGSRARGRIGAAAAGLHHSHWQCGIQAVSSTYTTAQGNNGSLTHWARPGMEPSTSRFLVGFVSAAPQRELPIFIFLTMHLEGQDFQFWLSLIYHSFVCVCGVCVLRNLCWTQYFFSCFLLECKKVLALLFWTVVHLYISVYNV